MSGFYLVQRCTLIERVNTERGFDGYFDLEYMGSSEFEFGAVGASLRRMRVENLDSIEFELMGKPVYLLAPIDKVTQLQAQLTAWVMGGCRGKEASYFDKQLDGTAKDWMSRVNLWWSLDDDCMFSLEERIIDQAFEAVASR